MPSERSLPAEFESDTMCPEPGGCASCPDPLACRDLRLLHGITTEQEEQEARADAIR